MTTSNALGKKKQCFDLILSASKIKREVKSMKRYANHEATALSFTSLRSTPIQYVPCTFRRIPFKAAVWAFTCTPCVHGLLSPVLLR